MVRPSKENAAIIGNANTLPASRKENILRYVNSTGGATIRELSILIDVSEATIRRDLDELSRDNMLVRTHGGARPLKSHQISYAGVYNQKSEFMVAEKKRIGLAAASYVNDGDTIILDSGTTTFQIALNLETKKHITVITNDLHIANAIVLDPTSSVFVTGGLRKGEFSVLTGSITKNYFRQIRVDKTFLSTDAIDIHFGLANAIIDEADLKKQMIDSAAELFVVADHSKFGKLALAKVCDLNDIDVLITDSGLSPVYESFLTKQHQKYVLA